MRKTSLVKITGCISLIATIVFFLPRCAGEKTNDAPSLSDSALLAPETASEEKLLFESKCSACHGSDGTAGIAGAADLQKSRLDTLSVIQTITNGRGGMSSFKNDLNEEQIRAVAGFVCSLRKY